MAGHLPNEGSTVERTDAVEAQLEALYASLPAIDCRMLCHPACGPIVMSAREHERLAARHGVREIASNAPLVCPYLEDETGLCGAYEVRPLICRLWGVVETMRCEWGCVPERYLTQAEAEALLAKEQALSNGEVRTVWPGWHSLLAQAAPIREAKQR